MNIKDRVFTGWRFTRWLYLVMGVTIMIQGGMAHQTMGIVLGGYFAAMAVFGFGCAGGNCAVMPTTKNVEDVQVEYEEITGHGNIK